MKKLTALFLTICLLLTLTACGGASKETMNYALAPMEGTYAKEEAAAADTAAANGLSGNSSDGSASVPQGRKWIITINMTVETEDLDSMMSDLDAQIQALDGYVEDQNIYNGSNRNTYRYRSANLTVRIPDDKVDSFTNAVTGIANVVSQTLNREDITLKYVSTSSRVEALETEEARLLELLAKAETMADLLEIESRLTEVRYELENHASQLRLYDNQIDYATIYLFIEEVKEYTPVEEPTFLERITDGFSKNLKGLGESIVDLIVWLITTSPYLVVCGVTILIVLLLIKRIRKINVKKAAKKNEEQK